MVAILSLWLVPALLASAGVASPRYRNISSKYNASNRIRVKTHDANRVCQGGVTSHTGWTDAGDHHMFFWYFEARNPKPDTPVMVWFTGGPGGSSVASAFVENGDCLYDPTANKATFNPYAWTEEFHMVYLDQPVGVGLSYIKNASDVSAHPASADDSAPDVIAFIRLFGEAFPHLADRPLHLAGESYGGRWIPVYGSWIQQYNHIVDREDRIPLASLIAISAWTHPAIQVPSMYDVACHPFKQFPPTLNSSICESMAAAYQSCELLLHACQTTDDMLACVRAGEYCNKHFNDVIEGETTNRFDRRMVCPEPGHCYPVMTEMSAWINSEPIFKDLLEVLEQSNGQKTTYSFMSDLISSRFVESGDISKDTIPYVENVLRTRKIPMLFTTSDADILVNPKGLRESLEKVRWPGRPYFRGAPWDELPFRTASGGSGGVLRRSDFLWYAELAEAGHMSPYDQRAGMLELMRIWLRHVTADDKTPRPLPELVDQIPLINEDL